MLSLCFVGISDLFSEDEAFEPEIDRILGDDGRGGGDDVLEVPREPRG